MGGKYTEITTETGFKCDVNPEGFKDWAFIELLCAEMDPALRRMKVAYFVMNRVLSPKSAEALKDMCRNDDGIAVPDKMLPIIDSIVSNFGDLVKK